MQGKKGKLKQQKQMPNTKCKMPNGKAQCKIPYAVSSQTAGQSELNNETTAKEKLVKGNPF